MDLGNICSEHGKLMGLVRVYRMAGFGFRHKSSLRKQSQHI
jgi:hypothetical protein